jgi:predicted RNA-binding protein YlqC (UPF0109 family)
MSDYVEGDINTIGDDEIDDEVEESELGDELEESELDEVDDNVGNGPGSLPEQVLVYLARSLARDPEAVLVEADERGGKLKLSLHVGEGDMGRVIGRRGRTAQAIRALVSVAGARTGLSTNVDIVDD